LLQDDSDTAQDPENPAIDENDTDGEECIDKDCSNETSKQ